ncbi:MAG: MATE family efflux transporter [Victivallales bacterium]|nr:MATE family efflux transporter [Victivallales bacterium]
MSEKFTLYSNRDLRLLIIPLIVEQMLFVTVGMADNVMVAFLGEASVSGVNIVDMLNYFLGNIFFALATGGAVVSAQFLGAKKIKEARGSVLQLLYVSLAFSLTVMLICELFSKGILKLIYGTLPPEVEVEALKYMRITAVSLPFIAVYGSCAALFRSMNLSKVTMYISLFSNLVNILGNALLIFGLGWGVSGAAYATTLARLFSMLVILKMLCNKRNPLYLSREDKVSVDWTTIRKILFIGIPSGIENGIFQFGRLLVVGLIATFGIRELAANSVAVQLGSIHCIPAGACGLALITVAGQAVGAGIEAQVRFYIKKMMTWCYMIHVPWSILHLCCIPLMLKFYTNLEPETLHLACILAMIHTGFGLFIWPASFVFPNCLRSANDVKLPMIVSVSSMLIVRIGTAYLLARHLNSGCIAVWIAMICDWIVRMVVFIWRYRSNAWLKTANISK